MFLYYSVQILRAEDIQVSEVAKWYLQQCKNKGIVIPEESRISYMEPEDTNIPRTMQKTILTQGLKYSSILVVSKCDEDTEKVAKDVGYKKINDINAFNSEQTVFFGKTNDARELVKYIQESVEDSPTQSTSLF